MNIIHDSISPILGMIKRKNFFEIPLAKFKNFLFLISHVLIFSRAFLPFHQNRLIPYFTSY